MFDFFFILFLGFDICENRVGSHVGQSLHIEYEVFTWVLYYLCRILDSNSAFYSLNLKYFNKPINFNIFFLVGLVAKRPEVNMRTQGPIPEWSWGSEHAIHSGNAIIPYKI